MEMMIGWYFHGKEADFLKSAVSQFIDPQKKNAETEALLRAIQCAYTEIGGIGMDRSAFPVPPEMVAMLAACAWVVMGYDSNEEIPLNRGDHDYIFMRLCRTFIIGAVFAAKEGKLRLIDGRLKLGSLTVPDWFPDWAESQEG